MTSRTVVALALALAWLGCSKSEPQAPAPVATRGAQAALPKTDATPPIPKGPAVTLPTIDVKPPADAPPNPRRTETACDRKEAGWKWVGTVVENGQCAVGPCTCVKE